MKTTTNVLCSHLTIEINNIYNNRMMGDMREMMIRMNINKKVITKKLIKMLSKSPMLSIENSHYP